MRRISSLCTRTLNLSLCVSDLSRWSQHNLRVHVLSTIEEAFSVPFEVSMREEGRGRADSRESQYRLMLVIKILYLSDSGWSLKFPNSRSFLKKKYNKVQHWHHLTCVSLKSRSKKSWLKSNVLSLHHDIYVTSCRDEGKRRTLQQNRFYHCDGFDTARCNWF